jgi:hypothetical protein
MSPVEEVGSAHVRPQGIAARAPGLFDVVESLAPVTSAQRYDQSEALALMASVATSRLMMHEQSYNAVPTLLLGAIIAWLVVLFASFGMFSCINATVISAIFVGALSVSAAIFLTVAMNHPYGGLMRLSAAPLQGVLAELNQ